MNRSRAKSKLLRLMRLPHDAQNIKTTIENLTISSEMTGVNLWVLVAAIFIASLGLNINATAVIIGAMLVSPLMGPIMGIGLSLGINDFALLKQAARSFLHAVIISVITSTIYFTITPVKEAGSELLARTSPTLYDVLIAFFGGVAGIIAGASALRRSNVIPGVAIATALMPPLCTVGYGLANYNMAYAAGAFYLFLINCVFICLATYLIVRFLNYPRKNDEPEHRKNTARWLIYIFVFLLIAPSIYLTYHIVKKYSYQQRLTEFIQKEVEDKSHFVVSSTLNYSPGNSSMELVMMGNIIDTAEQKALQAKLAEYDVTKCKLEWKQGIDSRQALKGEFDVLSTGLEIQKASVKDLYLMSDSLWNALNRLKVPDSLQTVLARRIYSLDSSLLSVSLNRYYAFNPSKNGRDTVWTINASFEKEHPQADRRLLDSVMQYTLGTEKVHFVYN